MILFYEDGRPEVIIPITLLVVLHREKSRRRREISSRNFLSVTVEDHDIIMAKMVYCVYVKRVLDIRHVAHSSERIKPFGSATTPHLRSR